MGQPIDHTSLHRTAKYFMDSGRVMSHEAAMALLEQFGLTICVGDEIAHSVHHQTALLTLINVARRTLLGGIEVRGLPDCTSLTSLAPNRRLMDAVRELGGVPVSDIRKEWPTALIGSVSTTTTPCWRVTWEGWRGGVIPASRGQRLAETEAIALSPALAAAVCAAEAFSYHAGDHPMASRRAAGLSLWRPGSDWLASDPTEPALAYLPSRLWLIGLGNLGQAFAWLLASLPYEDRKQVQFVLQDFDRIALSNDSTSLLSFIANVGYKKSRVVAEWLEARGFETCLEERRYGSWTRRAEHEPGAALCGVDNAQARAALEQAGFELVVEAGLGAGPNAFRSMSIHTFPASRSADKIWSRHALLASRTVGVPFVGLIAGCLVIAELLRRLHGGVSLEFASGSVAALKILNAVLCTRHPMPAGMYPLRFGRSDTTKRPRGGFPYAKVRKTTWALMRIAMKSSC